MRWKDQSTSWEPLKDLKQSFPVQVIHQYGIQLPKTVEDAYKLDLLSGTDLWDQAIMKEMRNNAVVFKFLEDGEHVPPGS